jgi:O-antigen ligase
MRHFHWRTFAAMGLAVGVLAIAAPDVIQKRIVSMWDSSDPSNYARLAIWNAGRHMVEAHPWSGVGPQRISRVFYDYHPIQSDRTRSGFYPVHMHNNLLQFAAERGIPCALAWLWLIVKVAWDHWHQFRRTLETDAQAFSAVGFAAVLVLFLAGLFEFNFGDSEVLMVFLFLVSAPYALLGPGGDSSLNRPDTHHPGTPSLG